MLTLRPSEIRRLKELVRRPPLGGRVVKPVLAAELVQRMREISVEAASMAYRGGRLVTK